MIVGVLHLAAQLLGNGLHAVQMPSTGTPSSNTAWGARGVFSARHHRLRAAG
jgi:hypothetical protein